MVADHEVRARIDRGVAEGQLFRGWTGAVFDAPVREDDDQLGPELAGPGGFVLGPPPVKMWMCPAWPLGVPVYSDLSTPTRARRHSKESALPVEMAMLGMFENFVSFCVFGSVSLDIPGMESTSFVPQATLGMTK